MKRSYQTKTPLLDEFKQMSDCMNSEMQAPVGSDLSITINEDLSVKTKETFAKEREDIFAEHTRERGFPMSDKSGRKTTNFETEWRNLRFDATEHNLNQEFRFRGNRIHTSKYTVLDFLPKNLFFQF